MPCYCTNTIKQLIFVCLIKITSILFFCQCTQVLLPMHQGVHPESEGRGGGVLPQWRALSSGWLPQQPPLGIHAGRSLHYTGDRWSWGWWRSWWWSWARAWKCGCHGEEGEGDMMVIFIQIRTQHRNRQVHWLVLWYSLF